MTPQAISGWHEHVSAGRQYLKGARNGLKRPKVFNNTLIFQMGLMAVEHLIVGVCQYHQEMPTDHTLSGLLEGLQAVCPMPGELAQRIRAIEARENICALTVVRQTPPGNSDVREILDVGNELIIFVNRHTPWDRGDQTAA